MVVTIRLADEGGKWKQPDELRLPLFEEALRHLSGGGHRIAQPDHRAGVGAGSRAQARADRLAPRFRTDAAAGGTHG